MEERKEKLKPTLELQEKERLKKAKQRAVKKATQPEKPKPTLEEQRNKEKLKKRRQRLAKKLLVPVKNEEKNEEKTIPKNHCSHKLTRGKRIGEPCGRRCQDTFCGYHKTPHKLCSAQLGVCKVNYVALSRARVVRKGRCKGKCKSTCNGKCKVIAARKERPKPKKEGECMRRCYAGDQQCTSHKPKTYSFFSKPVIYPISYKKKYDNQKPSPITEDQKRNILKLKEQWDELKDKKSTSKRALGLAKKYHQDYQAFPSRYILSKYDKGDEKEVNLVPLMQKVPVFLTERKYKKHLEEEEKKVDAMKREDLRYQRRKRHITEHEYKSRLEEIKQNRIDEKQKIIDEEDAARQKIIDEQEAARQKIIKEKEEAARKERMEKEKTINIKSVKKKKPSKPKKSTFDPNSVENKNLIKIIKKILKQ